MINVSKLDQELKVAGIQISGCSSAGIVWDLEGNEIQDREDVAAIILAHDPTDYVTPTRNLLASEAPDLLRNIPNWATWDTAHTVAYIEKNVTSLASAKIVLIAMAKMIVALRNATFSEIVADEIHKNT